VLTTSDVTNIQKPLATQGADADVFSKFSLLAVVVRFCIPVAGATWRMHTYRIDQFSRGYLWINLIMD